MKVAIITLASLLCLSFAIAATVEQCPAFLPETVEQYNKLHDFEAFIKKYGKEALAFLKCMGPTFVEHSGKQTISCLSHPDVVDCVSLIVCEGHDAKTCISHLKK